MCNHSFVALRTGLRALLGCLVVAVLAPLPGRTQSDFKNETWSVPNQWGSSDYTWVADFDGDGKADIASANRGEVYMHFSRGTRFENKKWSVTNNWGGSGYTWVADFDGDGKTDIASADRGNVYMYLSRFEEDRFATEIWGVPDQWGRSEYTWVADFDGDGKADIASAVTSPFVNGPGGTRIVTNVHMYRSSGHSFEDEGWSGLNEWWGDPGYTWVADFDGDGKADIASAPGGNDARCWVQDSCVFLHLSADSSSQDFWNGQSAVLPMWGDPDHTWVADFNGDGRADIASADGDNVLTHTFRGGGFECGAITERCLSESHKWRITKSSCDSYQCGGSDYTWVADFDGDGKADIATADSGTIHLHFSREGGFESLDREVPNEWGSPGYTWAADFDGDGKADIASANGSNVYMKLLASDEPEDLPPPPPVTRLRSDTH